MRRISVAMILPMMFLACGPEEGEVESLDAGLNIAYVSGHLGSEQACPMLTQGLSRSSCLAPCDSQPSECYNGALMIRVRNIVDHQVPVRLEKLELIQGSEITALEVREVATTEGRPFSGVDANSETTVRILFPTPSGTGSNVGKLRAIFSGEDGEKLELLTPQLTLVPVIAT